MLTVSKRDSVASLARKSMAASCLAVCFDTQDRKDQLKIQNSRDFGGHGHNLKAEQPTIINRCLVARTSIDWLVGVSRDLHQRQQSKRH